jgi:hypothetical protein
MDNDEVLPLPGIEPPMVDRPSSSPVTIVTELLELHLQLPVSYSYTVNRMFIMHCAMKAYGELRTITILNAAVNGG